MLAFVEGVVLSDPHWQPGRLGPWPDWARAEDVLIAHARLVRGLHEAAAGFSVEGRVWQEHDRSVRPGEIVCHGDLGPQRRNLTRDVLDLRTAYRELRLLRVATGCCRFRG